MNLNRLGTRGTYRTETYTTDVHDTDVTHGYTKYMSQMYVSLMSRTRDGLHLGWPRVTCQFWDGLHLGCSRSTGLRWDPNSNHLKTRAWHLDIFLKLDFIFKAQIQLKDLQFLVEDIWLLTLNWFSSYSISLRG